MAGNPVSGHTASNHTADSGAVIGATAPDGLRDGDHILSPTLTNFVESHHGNGVLLLEDGAYGSTRNDPDSLPGAVDVHQSTNSNYTLTVKGGHAILDGGLYSFANGYSGASPSSMSIVLGDADYTPGGSVSGTALSSGQEVLYTIFLTSDGGTHGGNSALHVRYEQGTPITTATNAYPNSPSGHLTEPDSSLSNKQSVVLASVRAIYQASSGGSHNIKITEINDKRVFIRPSVPQLFAPMTGGTVANTASGNAIDSANDLDGLHGTGTQSGDLVASDLGALWMSHSTATATDQMLYFSAKQGGTRSTFRIAPNKVESSSPSSNETFTFDDSNYFILTPSAAVDLNPSGTFPPGHTVLVSNRSSSYAVDFDKPEAATGTITVSNTDVANIGSGDTIVLISANGTTVTLTMQGTGGSTTSGSTSGATLTAKTLASGSYATPALHATAQAVEIRTAINHHTEFTATNSSNVITITQVNGGTAGNTTITITEIGATGLSKTDFSGGTRVNATSTITISNTDVANIGAGDTIVLISTDGTTVTLTLQGTGGSTTSSSTSGATLTSKTLSSGSYASASLHATAQAVEIRTAINHHTKFSATNSSNVITVTQAVGGADGNTTLTITELGATGMSNTSFTGGSGLADTVSALESCLFVYDGSAWQRAMVSSATPTPVSSGATGLVQLSDGSGGFTSDSKLYWTSGSSTFTVNGKLTVTGLIDPTGLVIDEKANIGLTGHTTAAGKGLLWVKNDDPNSLMFTDDAGTDVTIVSGGAPAIDINGLTGAAIASGDQIAFSDEGESGDPTRKESIDDIATLFAGAGLTASSAVMAVGAGNLIDVQANQVDVDLTEAAAATIAAGDNVIFLDGGASGTQSKGSVNDIATLFAGTASSTGLSASSGVMSVSDLHPVGVDGSANQILTDDGDGTVTSESKLTFDGSTLTVNTDFTGTTTATTKGAFIDFDATGITASGQTATNIGLDLDLNTDSPTMVGTVNNIGLDVDLTGGTSGAQTNIGVDVAVAGADANYAAKLTGGSLLLGTLSAAPADVSTYGQLWVKDNGSGAAKTELYFTNDNGDDIQITNDDGLAASGGASALNDLSDVSYSSGDLTISSLDTVTFANGGAATLTIANTAANTAGKNLTVSAGSEPGGGSNNADGGDLILASGGGDGTGTSSIQFKTKVSGTDAVAERMRIHTNGMVGIAEDEPQAPLHIKYSSTSDADPALLLESTATSDVSSPDIKLYRNSSSPADNDYVGHLVFTGNNDAGTPEEIDYAHIYAVIGDYSDGTEDGTLIFRTKVAGSDNDTVVIKNGRMGIGSGSPDGELHISGAGHQLVTIERETNTNGNGVGIHFQLGDSASATAGHNYAAIYGGIEDNTNGSEDGQLVFQTSTNGSASTKMFINSVGNVGMGTDSPAVDLEVLDTTASSATQGGNLRLSSNDGAEMADDHRLGVIEFAGAEDGSSTMTVGARIEAICDATWSASENGAALVMYTTDGNASQSEVLRLDSDKLATFGAGANFGGGITVGSGSTSVTTLSGGGGSPATIVTDTTSGLMIGTAVGQKIGFFSTTPVVQQAHINDLAGGSLGGAEATVNAIITVLQNFGLIASS